MSVEYISPIRWTEWTDTYSKEMGLYYRRRYIPAYWNISKQVLIRYLDNFQQLFYQD